MAVVSNLHEAKTNLSQLVDRAAAGEEIIIAKNGVPVARTNDPRLNAAAQEAIATAPIVFVSAASAWEAAIKMAIGRLTLPEPFSRGGAEQLTNTALVATHPLSLCMHSEWPAGETSRRGQNGAGETTRSGRLVCGCVNASDSACRARRAAARP
jgi:hypothetical protein